MEITVENEKAVMEWAGPRRIFPCDEEPSLDSPTGHYWEINTYQGLRSCYPGNILVKSDTGSIYPFSTERFLELYEPIEEENNGSN
jgi:hypothetical protein